MRKASPEITITCPFAAKAKAIAITARNSLFIVNLFSLFRPKFVPKVNCYVICYVVFLYNSLKINTDFYL